jgi:Flp pilus assembly protein TadD
MPLDPPKAEAWFTEGNRWMAEGDDRKAEACFRNALELDPDLAEALANLGFLKGRAGAPGEAEAYYRRAIAIRPDCVQVYLNLGALLMEIKRFAEAEAVYRQALRVAPGSAALWSNLGVLLACLKRENEALRCYETALSFDGSYPKAWFNQAYVLLRQGRYEEGWRSFETRDWYAVLAKHFTCPRWRGEALGGKSVVIGFEAGHGDMIQFCRYAAVLKSMGAAWVTVICHPALKVLFATLAGVDEVLSFEDPVPASEWDFWTPPMSLPHYCRTRLDTVPASIPYLWADPTRVERWSRRLPASGPRVGLAWKGNPRFENDGDRSLPSLEILAPFKTVSGVRFVSLQKGPGEKEAIRPPEGLSLAALGMDLADFADTAAVIHGLDLVISVDTAVVHLAGAMGKPCWVLLPDYRPDWRWLADRTDSPWYPMGMRLFRQPPEGGWPPVIAAVRDALRDWAEGK